MFHADYVESICLLFGFRMVDTYLLIFIPGLFVSTTKHFAKLHDNYNVTCTLNVVHD